MTARRHHRGDKAAGRRASKGEALRQAPEEPAFDMYKESLAGWEKERACQRGIFEARREGLLAAHPGKHIAVCEGEVFVADTALGAAQAAAFAHGGHAAFYYSPVPEGWRAPAGVKGDRHKEEEAAADAAYMAELARSQKETARQQEIFEANREEILAAHPGKHIAVCEGKVVVADTVAKLDQEIMRNHLGHPAFFCTPVSIPSIFGRVSD